MHVMKRHVQDEIQKLLAKEFAMDVIQSLDYSEEEIREAQTAMLTTS